MTTPTLTQTSRCARCSDEYPTRFAALSRTDNKRPVCSPCGRIEAVEQWQGRLLAQADWDHPTFAPECGCGTCFDCLDDRTAQQQATDALGRA